MAEVNLKVSADIQGIKTKLEELTKSVAEVQAKMGTSMKAAAETSEKAMVDASNTITNTMVNNTTKVISSLEKEEDQLKALQLLMKQSTNPDAQKSLQKEIDATNARIKSLGGSMQKFRDISVMSLGEMKRYMRELRNISLVGLTPQEIEKVNEAIAELSSEMRSYNATMVATGDKTALVISAFQGVIAAAQGVTGTLALFGVENKNLEKSMVALINLSQMMATVHDLNERGVIKGTIATIKDTAAKYLNITATRAQAISQKAATASTKAGAVGFKVLGAAMKSVPIVALVAGLAAVGTAAVLLYNKLGGMTTAQKAANDVSEKASELYVDEKVKLNTLVSIAKNKNKSDKERKEAIAAINAISPEMLGNIKLENIYTKESTDAIKGYIGTLADKAKAQAALELLIEAEKELQREQQKTYDSQSIWAKGFDQITSVVTTTQSVLTNGLFKQVSADEAFNIAQNASIKGLTERRDALANIVNATADVSDVTGESTKNTVSNTKATYDNTAAKKDALQWLKELYGYLLSEPDKIFAKYEAEWDKADQLYADRLISYNDYLAAYATINRKYFDEIDEFTRKVDEERAASAIPEPALRSTDLMMAMLKDDISGIQKLFDEGKITAEEYWDSLGEIQARQKAISEDTAEQAEAETAKWEKRIDIAKNMAVKLYDVYKKSIDDQIKAYDDLINQREQRIGEIQSLLEAEIQLNKDGFASNIGLYQSQLEQEQKLRDEALAQQDKYNKRKAVMESFEQSMDISSAIASILADAGVKFGVAAPIVGGLAIAALLTLFKQQQAKGAVKFEKGGRGVFEGADHAHGGIPFGNNKEAQGGEAYYILNRAATNSKGRKLMDVLFDAVNGGRVNFDAPLALADTPISVEMKEQREIKEIWKHLKGQKSKVYGPNYRIETFGNVTRKILN